ncbi:hypothetical protein AAFF_G00304180 [Aldrovandia affinis]|uniref:Uncharacterized protein n=1 Tax=Aldrovandia affinis TaxID=143900 RepID=A0AAD7SP00_9TELE|nr:hypothetical protein AAFF_G00304180 [Aldrovandia affinis]
MCEAAVPPRPPAQGEAPLEMETEAIGGKDERRMAEGALIGSPTSRRWSRSRASPEVPGRGAGVRVQARPPAPALFGSQDETGHAEGAAAPGPRSEGGACVARQLGAEHVHLSVEDIYTRLTLRVSLTGVSRCSDSGASQARCLAQGQKKQTLQNMLTSLKSTKSDRAVPLLPKGGARHPWRNANLSHHLPSAFLWSRAQRML